MIHIHIAEEYLAQGECEGEYIRGLRCKECGIPMKVIGCHVEPKEDEIDR